MGRWGEVSERIIKSVASLSTHASMTEEERKQLRPVRIDHRGALIPPPSRQVLTALALKGWMDYSAQMQMILDHPMPLWDELPEHIQDVWYRVARGQHAVMSLLGGSKVSQIDAE